jgi:hypothetical protein
VQDALYDAEEHLRAELAQYPGDGEPEVLARIVASYGAPEEVADAYRANEVKVQAALRTPRPRPRRTAFGRFFGVYADTAHRTSRCSTCCLRSLQASSISRSR